MAQISIRNNLLKRYNNKFRRNEKDACATKSSASFKVVGGGRNASFATDQLEESRVHSLLT